MLNKEGMKKIIAIILLIVLILSFSTQAFAVSHSKNDFESLDNNDLGYAVQSQGLDEYEGIDTNCDYWYENLPVYNGNTIRKTNVRRLKTMLHLLYYSPGNILNNTFDADTTAAVKAFQSDYGLTADGIVGSGTYNKLMTAHIMRFDGETSNWRVLRKGKKGDDVAQLQIRLYRMGYLDDDCDGVFGTNTELSLKNYQADKGLTADGIAGSSTFAKLYGSKDSYIREYRPCSVCNN